MLIASLSRYQKNKGRWIDNVFIERLWRSVKYEEIYLHARQVLDEGRVGLKRFFCSKIQNVETRHSIVILIRGTIVTCHKSDQQRKRSQHGKLKADQFTCGAKDKNIVKDF